MEFVVNQYQDATANKINPQKIAKEVDCAKYIQSQTNMTIDWSLSKFMPSL